MVALAVAAPAQAHHSGGCRYGRLEWTSSGCGKRRTATALQTTIYGITATISTSGDTSHSQNGVVTSSTTGGQSPVLRFYDENGVNNTSQTVTIVFNQAVSNVSFSLLDVDSSIDRGGREYEDVVTILAPAGWAGTTHANVQGDGTSAHPYRAVTTSSPVSGSSQASNVDLTFAGPLTQIQFTYAQDGTVHGDPFIGISDISFEYCG